ncbi:MAG: hypothetical protein ED559_11135 [Phycisphaera sp.]|nr:MAG: hypothetical protein ED559_11135 [Phycisphaera sp.]
MLTNRLFVAGCAVAASTAAHAQTELSIYFDVSQAVAAPGDIVTYTIMAELLNPTGTVLATVADIGFNLSMSGDDLTIQNNDFSPAFDSDFFGPANDGVVSGDAIIGALGGNTLPPLNNAGGPDSSNPLTIYSFDVVVPANPAQASYRLEVFELVGQVTGAYTGVPFPIILTYQDAQGNPGDTSVSFQNSIFTEFQIIPAPSSGLALLGLGALAARRRR